MKMNTTTIVLLAAAAAGGYYFYTKNKSAKEAASSVTVEEEKETTEEEKPSSSYGTPSGYGSSPAYATAAAPLLVKTSTSAPKQRLTILKKLSTGEAKFTDILSKAAKSAKVKRLKKVAKRKMAVKRKVSGFDTCIGLF